MAESIIIGVFDKVVAKVVAGVATAAITQNIQKTRCEFENLTIETKIETIKTLVNNATEILDKRSGLDLDNLVYRQIQAEFYQNTVTYIFKHKSMVDIPTWKKIEKELDQLILNLERAIGQASGQTSSGQHNEDEKPPRNLRRFLLFLSVFTGDVVLNHKRITRLSVANEFTPENGSESLLQQLANWVEVVDHIWPVRDRVALAHHFRLRNVNREKWPEKHSPWPQNFLMDGTNKILKHEKHLSSLLILGRSAEARQLEKKDFLCLRILTLRNINLTDTKHLKKLILLQYLDLKHTDVQNCDWLESLEELQVLDLRYTLVEAIPDNCLEKLGKLKHLLLGYSPKKGANGLTGVKLNIDKLRTENLETLRAIRRPNETNGSISKVADLYFTGLKTKNLKNFWEAVKNFEKLTSLGVSMTKGSVITLQDCPMELKVKLKRLRMEGQFSSSSSSSQTQTCLQKLKDFTKLIDLTLVSPKAINSIPPLPNLICLRLYGICDGNVLTFNEQGFNGLKKLVIGDMENVKTVKIGSVIITALATLKLCNLPRFTGLVCDDSEHPLLRIDKPTSLKFKKIRSQKNIFLKDITMSSSPGNTPCWMSPNLNIYHYDMNKQCYKEVVLTSKQ